MEMGEEGDYRHTSLYCHHQNGSCIKMGSDEGHFHVSVIDCEGQNHKTVSTDQRLQFLKREDSRSGFERRSEPTYRSSFAFTQRFSLDSARVAGSLRSCSYNYVSLTLASRRHSRPLFCC